MNEEQKLKIEEAFRKVASETIEDSKLRLEEGEEAIQKIKKDSVYRNQKLIDMAGEHYAFATEIALKGNIIFDDFRKNPRFNQDTTKPQNINGKDVQCYGIGTSEWRKSLSADKDGTKILNDPKEIKKLVLENNSLDERSKLESDPVFNKEFLTLSYDGKKANGHSLYSYYQLQNSIAKNLINTEYYCYVEDEIKYTIYALLTEDILSTSSSGKTIIPKSMMEGIDSSKEKAIELRYASISGMNLTKEELEFLHNFSSSVINAGEYRFPLPKAYSQIDFEKYDYNRFKHRGIPFFDNLDKIAKYNLQSCFSIKEIDALVNYINLLVSAKTSTSDINIFINSSIYFKYYTKNKLKINLSFTEQQYGRIDNFCKLTKAFQPFDEKSKLLRENDAFVTEEQRNQYKEEIQKQQIIAEKERQKQTEWEIKLQQLKENIEKNQYIPESVIDNLAFNKEKIIELAENGDLDAIKLMKFANLHEDIDNSQEQMLEQLEYELEELYKDLEALTKQYDNPRLAQGRPDIWNDINYTADKIRKVEAKIESINQGRSIK